MFRPIVLRPPPGGEGVGEIEGTGELECEGEKGEGERERSDPTGLGTCG